jgi:hypothetical protein
MAGVLFLLNKKNQPITAFKKKCELLKKHTLDLFAASFDEIEFLSPEKTSFLILFKKNNQKKFYRDQKDNWLAFE